MRESKAVLKKFLSILVVMSMMMVNMCVSAEDNTSQLITTGEDGLYFELDLSDYDDVNHTVKNAVTDTTDGLAVYPDEATKEYYPELHTMTTVGGSKSYIVTATENQEGTVTEKGFVNLYKEYGKPTAEADNLTVEGWYRPDMDGAVGNYRKLFNLSKKMYNSSSTDGTSLFVIDNGAVNGNAYRVRFPKDENGSSFSGKNITSLTKGEWVHLVATKTWDASTGKWTVCVYKNGVLQTSWSDTGVKENAYDEATLQIGTIGNAQGRTFIGAIGDFKLYNTALSEEKVIEKYNESKNDYIELSENFDITGIADYDTIDPYVQSLTINFTNYFTADEAKRAVSLKKEVGDNQYEEVRGGYTVEADGTANSVVLKFGKLDSNANYSVFFDDMKALNGVVLEKKKLNLSTNDGLIYISTDFSGLTVASHPTTEDTGLTFMSSGTAGADDIYVRQNEQGVKYLEINSTADTNKDSYIAYNFLPGITTPIKVEMGISGNELTGSSFARAGRINDGGSGAWGVLHANGNIFSATNVSGTKKNSITDKVNEDGFFHIKSIINPTQNGTLTWQSYNEDDSSFYVYGEKSISKINSIRMQQYLKKDDNSKIYVSYLKISSYALPEITSESTYRDKMVVYSFNDDLNTETLKNITVTDDEGNTVLITPKYNESARTLELIFENELYINKKYTVSFENAATVSGDRLEIAKEIKFGSDLIGLGTDVVFTNGDNEQMSSIYDLNAVGDEVTAEFELVNMAATDKNIKIMLAMYENGILKAVSVTDKTIVKDGAVTPCEAVLKTVAADSLNDCEIKLFVWDGFNTMRPIVKDNWRINPDGVCL